MLNAVDDLINALEQQTPTQSCGTDGRSAFEMISDIHISHHEGRKPVRFPIKNRDLVINSN